jgi:dihydroorotate dehydrogenase
LAAGFDKNAVIVQKLPDLGFGFAEIGTVTPRPQEGNPRPRLFRFVERQAIFNQMGFNNLGAEAVANNLAHARKKMKARGGNVATFLVGVNIGKNKETSPEDAPQDYADAIRPFEGLADYVVINVSSPNTPGLRALQTAESLQKIVEATKNVVLRWKSPRPIYLKLAPELHGPELSGLIAASNGWGIEGWVLTNTLGGDFSHPTKGVTWGGWSGSPVAQASLQSLRTVRSQSSLNIDSVGGILSPQAARERVELGADRIQIYSGWVFNGPRFPSQIARFFEK